MQGKKQYTEKLFTNFQLSDRVPKENFYRRLSSCVDFRFLYKATAKYYGTEGQQSIDPVVFFKLILIGYLENLNSDRKIIDHCRLRLDLLLFPGYDIDEELSRSIAGAFYDQPYAEVVWRRNFQGTV